MPSSVLSLIAGRGKLCLEMKCHRAFGQTLVADLPQISSAISFQPLPAQMHNLFGRDDERKAVSAAALTKSARRCVILFVT